MQCELGLRAPLRSSDSTGASEPEPEGQRPSRGGGGSCPQWRERPLQPRRLRPRVPRSQGVTTENRNKPTPSPPRVPTEAGPHPAARPPPGPRPRPLSPQGACDAPLTRERGPRGSPRCPVSVETPRNKIHTGCVLPGGPGTALFTERKALEAVTLRRSPLSTHQWSPTVGTPRNTREAGHAFGAPAGAWCRQ